MDCGSKTMFTIMESDANLWIILVIISYISVCSLRSGEHLINVI